ncbi:DNA repair protein RadC [Amphritea sp. 1_MG-2023]|uniref:RadC family protein n=1 Tax=Amphritea sp. 1_MG-2023 TaxID=3062670 RepID=UPI0026E2CA9B|nr:DNA repair protein RadC [Amphritea sp. 1_MG-2023]MDO6562633.1 DNA repair protein RadC [Amphritea sp. 1_MG-2023]
MTTQLIAGELPGTYVVPEAVTDSELMRLANLLARRRLKRGRPLSNLDAVISSLQTLLMNYEREVFGMILLDNRHRIIEFVELFMGSINSASVYPREVVKKALLQNAAAVILVHNHPSGDPDPSQADRDITNRLQEALGTVEVRLLDHIVVGVEGTVSFAERGLI